MKKVAKLQCPALSVEPTVLTQEHTVPHGFKVEGSIKTGHYSIELQSSYVHC